MKKTICTLFCFTAVLSLSACNLLNNKKSSEKIVPPNVADACDAINKGNYYLKGTIVGTYGEATNTAQFEFEANDNVLKASGADVSDHPTYISYDKSRSYYKVYSFNEEYDTYGITTYDSYNSSIPGYINYIFKRSNNAFDYQEVEEGVYQLIDEDSRYQNLRMKINGASSLDSVEIDFESYETISEDNRVTYKTHYVYSKFGKINFELPQAVDINLLHVCQMLNNRNYEMYYYDYDENSNSTSEYYYVDSYRVRHQSNYSGNYNYYDFSSMDSGEITEYYYDNNDYQYKQRIIGLENISNYLMMMMQSSYRVSDFFPESNSSSSRFIYTLNSQIARRYGFNNVQLSFYSYSSSNPQDLNIYDVRMNIRLDNNQTVDLSFNSFGSTSVTFPTIY